MRGPLLSVSLINTLLLFCAGGYMILKDRLPNYVVPDLTGFTVCPPPDHFIRCSTALAK